MCSTCLDRKIRYTVCFGYKVVARLQLFTSFVPTPRLGLVILVIVLMCDYECNGAYVRYLPL
jgi:hypothetical protein